MENKHTPAPWEVAWEDGKHGIIAHPCEEWTAKNGAKFKARGVAVILNPDGDDRNDIRKANANLIAAAPELLEALESLPLDYFDKPEEDIDAADFVDCSNDFIETMVKARKAIAKAKGETNA